MVQMVSLLLQAATWLWPIVGAQPGDGIISQPQDMIGEERNFSELFVAAPEGTDVVAPDDATLDFSCLNLMQSLTTNMAYGGSSPTFNGQRSEKISSDGMTEETMQYVNGSVTLRLKDGRKVHIIGLRGDVPMKSGMRFRRGDRIGTVSWVYPFFRQPHVCISVSSPSGTPDDPMKPFGIPSTFVPQKMLVIPETLTRQQALEDIDFLLASMHECFPEFRSVVSEEKEAAFRRECLSEMTGSTIPTSTMLRLLGNAFTTRLLHDSHANVSGMGRVVDNSLFPHLKLGALHGKLIVTQAQPGYESYLQREVASVGGRTAEDLISEAWLNTSNYDEDIRSVPERQILMDWRYYMKGVRTVDGQKQVVDVTFTDGTSVTDTLMREWAVKPYLPNAENLAVRVHSIDNCVDEWTFRMPSDSVMLLTLGTFELSATQVDEVADSLRAHIDTPYLIIDVRDNSGGHASVDMEMASWMLDAPTRPVRSWQQVGSDSTYKCFSSCINYDAKSRPFKGYNTKSWPDSVSPSAPIVPSGRLHYGGRILVLANETSFSAASDFPARLVREGRALAIGRETGTGYHAMTALKFAQLMLPHSKFQYRLPLVRCVSDAEVTPRFPAGRGLLPDIEVPLSWEEMFQSEEDVILRRALEYIQRGENNN